MLAIAIEQRDSVAERHARRELARLGVAIVVDPAMIASGAGATP